MRIAAALPLFVALVSGCGAGGGDTAGTMDNPLQGRTFLSESVVEDGAPRPLVEGTTIRLTFTDDGALSAHAGCNNIGAPVQVEADRIVVSGPMAMTEMGCAQALHEQDEWVASFLSEDPGYTVAGDTLTLRGARAVIVLRDREVADPDRPLQGTVWEIDGLIVGQTASSLPAATAATLSFRAGRVTVEIRDCGRGQADAEVIGSSIRFENLVWTDKGCPEPAATVRTAIEPVLRGTVRFEITAASLRLSHPSGRGLTLKAHP